MTRPLPALLRRLRAEDGAVTVDWVVLTAAIVAVGAIAGAAVFTNTTPLAEKIGAYIGAREVDTE